MTIYSVNSEILYEAPLTEDALIKYELMGDYYIELPFDAGSYIDIPRGSYIDHEGTRYTVMENILPEPKAEGGYHYAVKFWAGQSFMKNRKLFWLKGANKESSFHITTTIDQFGQLVVDNMNEFMPGKWELSSLLPAESLTVSKTISFEGDSCWDAVSSIAEAYGIEWWVHHDYDRMELYFGKLEGDNLVDFKVGEAITSIPSQKGDDSQYGTRFYVYGSNQNLPEGYGDTEQGGTVHHVSNPRLMLPSGIDYIDAKRDMTPAEIIEQVVIFEDVYPKNTDTVTAVTTVQRPIENAAEGQPQTFTAYQLIAANTPFLPSDVMENETLRLVFNSGALTGVEFEVDLRDADDNHIDPLKWKPEDGFIKKFELIAITEQVGDTVETLPNESVHPVVGDEFVLLGVRLSDDKVREAEEELLQRGEEWKDEHSKDTSVYNCPTNPVYCKHGLLSFALGQRVRLYDPRFDGGYRDSRIQGFEKRIWNEYIATYTIGDNAAYTRIGAVESSVTNLKTTERTIGMILDELASTAKELSTMFEMVEYNKTKMIRANYDFFSVGGVTASGIGSSSGGGTGGGGSSTLSGLNDVALKTPMSSDVLVYNGSHWTNTPMSSIKPDLTAYATKSWVEGKGYALNSALLAVDARLEDVETIFTADQDGAINKWSEVVAFLDGIEGDTLDSILAQFATIQWVENKKYITADALAPYALKTAIPTKNSELENDAKYITAAALNGYATQNWVESKKYLDGIDSTMVIDALGYTPYNAVDFTKANIKSTLGISDWALASAKPTYQYSEIQGIPDLSVYFLKTSFTKDNIKTTLGISDWALAASKPSYKWSEINERPTKLSQFTDDVVKDNYLPIGGTAKNAEKLGNQAPAYYATATALTALSDDVTEFRTLFDSLFEKDDANNAIKAKLSLYSVGGITAGGIGSGGSSSGGGGASYNRLDAWADYTNDKSGWVLSALLGKDLDTRVNVLANAGYITPAALDPYAKAADVANTYATQTALQGVDIRVQAIEYIFEKDQDGVINKWQEIVDFLAGVEGSTLDGILEQFATKDSLAGYLPLSGGTLTNSSAILTLSRTVNGAVWIDFFNSTGKLGAIGIGGDQSTVPRSIYFHDSKSNKDLKVWHEGNMGKGSGLAADSASKVSGFYTSNLDKLFEGNEWSASYHYCERTAVGLPVNTSNANSVLTFKESYHYTTHPFGWQLAHIGANPQNLYMRSINAATPKEWREFAFVDSNVASATKLQTPRELWGQSFDGTGNVSGRIASFQSGIPSMTTIDNVLGSENLWLNNYSAKFTSANNALVIAVSGVENERSAMIQSGHGLEDYAQYLGKLLLNPLGGNVGIGTTNPAERLDVAGNIKTSGSVRIGDAILSWDATNKCITIKNANTGEKASLFVDGGVTGTAIN